MLPDGYWCIWKCWNLEECSDLHQRAAYFSLAYFLTTALSPRYTFHVLRNSIAPSPIVQARQLDRMDPSTRSQWIKEWRSFRGGGQVKRSSLSPPPSPSLESHVDFYPQSPVSPGDEFGLNVFGETYLRPRDTWGTKTCLQCKGLFILKNVNIMYQFKGVSYINAMKGENPSSLTSDKSSNEVWVNLVMPRLTEIQDFSS